MTNKPQLIILGAGKPHFGKKASAIKKILKNQKTLNFTLDITKNHISSVKFISGYDHKKIQKEFPKLKIFFNKYWKKSGPIFSLSKSKINLSQDIIIMYSDILVRKNFFEKIINSKADVTISCDSYFLKRFKDRNLEDIKRAEKIAIDKNNNLNFFNNRLSQDQMSELMGLIKISKKNIPLLNSYLKSKNKKINNLKLIDLLKFFYNVGLKIDKIDSYGDWAEINDSKDISKFILGSKSETLIRLKNILRESKILDQVKFSVQSWKKNKDKILDDISKKFKNKFLIVRSSSTDEDGLKISNAGKYESVLNIKGKTELKNAILKVIKSFDKENLENEIFVQEHIKNSKYVGVVTTKSKETGSPWYVINYQKTSNTEIITKGDTNNVKTIFLRRDSSHKYIKNPVLIKLIKSIKEIEQLLINESLDLEFAINKKNEVLIFQIRPLVLKYSDNKISKEINKNYIYAEENYKNFKINSQLKVNKHSIFGVMPDWNPAEIIGFKPNKLSISLYERLITNKIWAKQRDEFGYRRIKSPKLLKIFAGTPYVCVDKSLESFIPKKLSKKISKKILNQSLNLLKKNPNKHDKIEFEIIPNCLDFNYFKWQQFYKKNNFTNKEIINIHNNLKIINYNAQVIFLNNLKKLKMFNKIKNYNKKSNQEKIKKLLKICSKDLTLIFSHFARCAFISVIIFKSALENRKINKKKYNEFFNSINTISKTFQTDIALFQKRKISKKDLILKYGHLRPGTYDINSERYDENFETLIQTKNNKNNIKKTIINKEKIFDRNFLEQLKKIGFNDTKENVINFFYGSIENREYSKFLFTKYLSDVLKLISIEFNKLNINNQEISSLSIKNIEDFFSKKINKHDLKKIIRINLRKQEINNRCDMPNLITSVNDFKTFSLSLGEPNFVGTKSISKDIVFVKNYTKNKVLEDKIVIIDSADPGYDWIFNHKIEGLITKYGGVNSHMAIRCAELNLTAAIGVGEKIFVDLKNSSKVIINPKNKILEIL